MSPSEQKIIPVRANGNLLLCTLLLGNVAVNALLSIVLANLTSGVVGFILSTAIITLFGEIIPQVRLQPRRIGALISEGLEAYLPRPFACGLAGLLPQWMLAHVRI